MMSMSAASRIVISTNEMWNIVNFRSGLVKALREAGYSVICLAGEDQYVEAVRALGCEVKCLPLRSHGLNPLSDALLAFEYFRLLRHFRPKAYLSFTAKPNIYGAVAAWALGIPAFCNVAGLGSGFTTNGWLRPFLKLLYRVSLRKAQAVFFQNAEDLKEFVESGLVEMERARLLPGSGVDLSRFVPSSVAPVDGGAIRALFVGRLLREKGVQEFARALACLRRQGVPVKGSLLGPLDLRNPRSVSKQEIDNWESEGLVEYLGRAEDVRAALGDCDVVVLPSYYKEGTPRALLEAAAVGRPLITTTIPGCKDLVVDGVNGYLVPPRDVSALADALRRFATLSTADRKRMGGESRRMVENRYDERIVIGRYFEVLQETLGDAGLHGNA